ncbi:hypothetical protein [Deinococcus multiflagellatus]|uniref:Uncharacterized protein n=1 Tax=Deinococcus multiflagellatus TaxID=1656887 RepID=A0ABW1ZQT6_9DEIO|nr:hypothetical protein [Deinococcus multiflagellatus]MBZ9715815.1 hypothetical protein [Deinococcus multiflagellatus]
MPEPHPTLRLLAQIHFGGDVRALVRLLDDLNNDTLRDARTERHHAWPQAQPPQL